MPLPHKRPNEGKKAFISRCAGDSVMNKEFPDQATRLAVCYSRWGEKKKKASFAYISNDDEFLIEDASSMKKLPARFQKKLNEIPETGMGYHKVKITMKDGKVHENVDVYNCSDFDAIEPSEVEDIADIDTY